MKKYIFITMNLGGINGAEQYIYNKMNYLSRKGYQTYVFSGRKTEILIHAFDQYNDLVHPAFRLYPSSMNKHEIDKLINWVLAKVDYCEEDSFIVESSNNIDALWGEIIAEKLQCRHFAYILHEKINLSPAIKDFFLFKVNRHELAGIDHDSVDKMLGDLAPGEERSDTTIRAFCANTIQDCEENFTDLLDKGAETTIGSIGRLEKEYVVPLVNELCSFFHKHSTKRFNMVMIGGCADKHREIMIQEKLAKCSNVTALFTGALYPIPKNLVNHIDLFVSASGSATATFYMNRPTIRIDCNTGRPLGLIGYDYQLRSNDNKAKHANIEEYIDLIENNKISIHCEEDYETKYIEAMECEFDRHLMIANEDVPLNYYNTKDIRYTDLKYRACALYSKLFGAKGAYRLIELLRKFVKE